MLIFHLRPAINSSSPISIHVFSLWPFSQFLSPQQQPLFFRETATTMSTVRGTGFFSHPSKAISESHVFTWSRKFLVWRHIWHVHLLCDATFQSTFFATAAPEMAILGRLDFFYFSDCRALKLHKKDLEIIKRNMTAMMSIFCNLTFCTIACNPPFEYSE